MAQLCNYALLLMVLLAGSSQLYARTTGVFHPQVFNIRDYGATGEKADDARPAIQNALDAAAAAGGGTVYLPPGEYTSGTLLLHSHVNVYLEAGATLFASKDPKAFAMQKVSSKDALFFGEGLDDISIGGRGTVDGQQEYEWRLDTPGGSYSHRLLMQALGKPLIRTFPVGYPQRTIYPHLVWLGRCTNVNITGLSFLHSPSWTFALYACERVLVDGVYIYTTPTEAVWADGIDVVSCKDVRIANSSIVTGDDCIALVSTIHEWGPGGPCENILVTNCRFTSGSAAVKFTEGNADIIRNVVITDCVISDTNRGITFQIALGGTISDVIVSNITMNLHRYDWFWAGDSNPFNFDNRPLSEWSGKPRRPGEPAGTIRNILIHDIIVHCQGSSYINGDPDNWLDGITFENIKLYLSSNPASPYDETIHAMTFHWVRNVKVRNVEVIWDKPASPKWQSALYFEDADQIEVDGFSGRQAFPDEDIPAVVLNQVTNAEIRDSRAQAGTGVFLGIQGAASRNIRLFGNDFHEAKIPYEVAKDVRAGTVEAVSNFLPSK